MAGSGRGALRGAPGLGLGSDGGTPPTVLHAVKHTVKKMRLAAFAGAMSRVPLSGE
jgi:hypothetical protein